MNWKQKSLIQRTCAALPFGSEAFYYFLQRNFGSMRHAPDPMPNLREFVGIAEEMREMGFSIEGRRAMEVGTGRRLDMPIAMYLAGAASVVTVDLHQYMKHELAQAAFDVMKANKKEILEIFGRLAGNDAVAARFAELEAASSTEDLMRRAKIEYRAPSDASRTGLPSGSIDFQFSYTVFEHIPYPVLAAILKECSRLLSPQGIACHHIDPSDHFAHDDQSINFCNFLRFEDDEFDKVNDNQFAYQNRLRVTDFERLYREVNHEIIKWRTWNDQRSADEIRNGFPLAAKYRGVPVEVLTTVVIRAYSRAGK